MKLHKIDYKEKAYEKEKGKCQPGNQIPTTLSLFIVQLQVLISFQYVHKTMKSLSRIIQNF